MRIDAKDIEARARGRWNSIFQMLGIEVGENNRHVACPICGPGRNSHRFRMDNKNGSGSWICTQCGAGDGITLVQKYLGITFPETLEKINEIIGGVHMDTQQTTNKMSTENIKKMLNKIWNESKELTGSDWVCRYLHDRGLVLQPDNVRFCQECYESDSKTKMPAMVARIVNKDNVPQGIHRSYLDSDVPKQADINSPKKMTYVVDTLSGCTVRLFQPGGVFEDGVLGIGEGIETCIAATQIFNIATWSCLSSTLMESWEPPEGIRRVVILADNDASHIGAKSAYTLANRLYKKDLIVEVRLPETIGSDWADELWRTIKP